MRYAIANASYKICDHWKFVSSKIGKKAVYFIGTSFWILAQIGLFAIQPGQISEVYILAILAGFGVSVAYLIPWSMIPDVIELDLENHQIFRLIIKRSAGYPQFYLIAQCQLR